LRRTRTGRRRSDRLIEQFIESLHFGCNFIATASLSRSAGDQAILRWAKPRPTAPLVASGNVQTVTGGGVTITFVFDFGTKTSVKVHDFHASDLLKSAAWTRHQL
jgi:hypothetical protein